jgi:ATP-dependent Lhr-like helicase
MSERAPGGFAAVYRVLAAFEETGRCRRGYFVEGSVLRSSRCPARSTGCARWPARAERDDRPQRGPGRCCSRHRPGQPVRCGLPWPGRGEDTGPQAGPQAGRPGRARRRHLVLYVERGGRTLLTWSDEPHLLQPAVDALALAVREVTSARSPSSGRTVRVSSTRRSALPWSRPASTPRLAACACAAGRLWRTLCPKWQAPAPPRHLGHKEPVSRRPPRQLTGDGRTPRRAVIVPPSHRLAAE